jgi:hypothetical protein
VTGEEFPFDPWDEDLVERGGPGSGHFGHEGRPGEVGGSQPADFHEAPGRYRDFGWDEFRSANAWGNNRNRSFDYETRDPDGTGWESLRFYSNTGHYQVNDWLRSGEKGYKKWALADIKNTVQGLDKMLGMFPLKENVLAYRGVDADFFKKLRAGRTFSDKAYVSTTLVEKRLSPDFHEGEGGFDAHLLIKIPVGVHAYYIGGDFGGRNEYELLLERGLRFKVESVDRSGRTAVLRVVR